MNVYSCKNEKKSTFSNHRVQVKLAKYCNGSHIKKKKNTVWTNARAIVWKR